MVKFVQMLFCDRNVSPRTIGQRRNIRLCGNAGFFTVLAVLARNGATCTLFREPLSSELYADNKEVFRRFAIDSKSACKIAVFPVYFGCSQNENGHFNHMKHFCNIMR